MSRKLPIGLYYVGQNPDAAFNAPLSERLHIEIGTPKLRYTAEQVRALYVDLKALHRKVSHGEQPEKGICAEIPNSVRLFLSIVETWPHYSGNFAYPVPCTSKTVEKQAGLSTDGGNPSSEAAKLQFYHSPPLARDIRRRPRQTLKLRNPHLRSHAKTLRRGLDKMTPTQHATVHVMAECTINWLSRLNTLFHRLDKRAAYGAMYGNAEAQAWQRDTYNATLGGPLPFHPSDRS